MSNYYEFPESRICLLLLLKIVYRENIQLIQVRKLYNIIPENRVIYLTLIISSKISFIRNISIITIKVIPVFKNVKTNVPNIYNKKCVFNKQNLSKYKKTLVNRIIYHPLSNIHTSFSQFPTFQKSIP